MDVSLRRSLDTVHQGISFAPEWHVLGPFQTGTREAAWGADPLELHGGFHALNYDHHVSFPSSLAANGTVRWTATTGHLAGENTVTEVDLTVRFPDVDWRFQQQVYGWAALQWQAWARGEFAVHAGEPIPVVFQADSVLEYWIDDDRYWGGDIYETRRAPLVLHLKPGRHRIDVRVVREVRAMGGVTDDPRVDLRLLLNKKRQSGPLVQTGTVLVPDFIAPSSAHKDSVRSEGGFASQYASILLRNNAISSDIRVVNISIQDAAQAEYWSVAMLSKSPIVLAPGQTRPVTFTIRGLGYESSHNIDKQLKIQLRYTIRRTNGSGLVVISLLNAELHVQFRDVYEPHKVTYMHPSGIVSYAMLRPPRPDLWRHCGSDYRRLPILLSLHGAGVEADSEESRTSFDGFPDACAWTLIPSGVTPWCGDDWHIFGQRDVQAAVGAVFTWSQDIGWRGPDVDANAWLLAGHSNGGQGAWATLLHYPDRIIAAAPVSGYTSIQNYVPYHFWHNAQASKMAVIQSTLETWRHELLLPNGKGIPLLQQHGSTDDNVPPYHSRLMHQLLPEAEWISTYHEIPNMPHWWTGIMTTPQLRGFFESHLPPKYSSRARADRAFSPQAHLDFELVTANPADTDTKSGFKIQLLQVPGRLGRIRVVRDVESNTIDVQTANVRAFSVPWWFWRARDCAKRVTIDGQDMECEVPRGWPENLELPFDLFIEDEHGNIEPPEEMETYIKDGVSTTENPDWIKKSLTLWRQDVPGELDWALTSDLPGFDPEDIEQAPLPVTRWGRQLGSIESILRTNGAFNIVAHVRHPSSDSAGGEGEGAQLERLALQVSRNMQTYFYADSVIYRSVRTSSGHSEAYTAALQSTGNIISLALGGSLPLHAPDAVDHAIEIISPAAVRVSDPFGRAHVYSNDSYPGLGAIFLRPLPDERLELVVWGADVAGLRRAARLIPMMTGTGVPDFVVLDGTAAWKGVEGALALGFMDEKWRCSVNSFLT